MDTKYLHEALRNWQENNGKKNWSGIFHQDWGRLSQAQRSEVVQGAQSLKENAGALTIDEVLAGFRRTR